jgi:hypothetical protein
VKGWNEMSVFSERLYDELSQRLARKDKHAKLLKMILQWLEEGGGEAVQDGVKEMAKRIRGE